MDRYPYYIGGELRISAQGMEVVDPYHEEVFSLVAKADKQALDYALTKAREAQRIWEQTSYKERAALLKEIAKVILDNLKRLAELESRQIGKPLKESLFVDIPLGAQCFQYYANFLETLQQEVGESEYGIDIIDYSPLGVVGVYLPYNVPLMAFGFSCAAALASGNAVIIKPSEYGCLSLLELAQYISKLDLPKGLINIVTGEGSLVGKYLAESELDALSFTGSENTFRKIMTYTKEHPRKIICELGGCNLSLVFKDADIDSALQNLIAASFLKSGQICIGTSLILIEEAIIDKFKEKFIEMSKSIKLGDPFSPDTGMGPLPTPYHLEFIHKKVEELCRQGGRILCGGSPLKGKGYFYPPTVIGMEGGVIYEELFGPVVMLKAFKLEELESIVEDNPTGLVLHIWTKDNEKAHFFAKKAHCGTVWVNTFAQMDPKTPFGGMKKSGWSRNLGRIGFWEYTHIKHIGWAIRKSPVWGWFGL